MAELDIEKLKSCTAIKQIPILTLDERWYHLITDKLKTDEICYWEKQVNELLKKQGQVNNDIKEVKKIKNQLIQDVVDNMQDEDNDPKRAKVMEKNQRLIQEAKDKGTLIDATYGRRTRAVLIMDSDHVVLSAVAPETVGGRAAVDEEDDDNV